MAKANSSSDSNKGKPTVASWCEHCVDVIMPSQRSGAKPRYSEETLADLRQVIRKHIVPKIGKVPVLDLDKATVMDFITELPSDDIQAKTLYVLTRVMELAETKGNRKRGTNPCKGVSLEKIRGQGAVGRHPTAEEPRPSNWRERDE